MSFEHGLPGFPRLRIGREPASLLKRIGDYRSNFGESYRV